MSATMSQVRRTVDRMELNEVMKWLGLVVAGITAVAAFVGGLLSVGSSLTQMLDRRRKQASQVTVERQRLDGSWKVLVYHPSDAPIRKVVAVMADEFDPPMPVCLSWPEVVAGVLYTYDMEQNLLASVLPLSETYFTDARGKHWRIDATDRSLHQERKSVWNPDPSKITEAVLRRWSARDRREAGSVAGVVPYDELLA